MSTIKQAIISSAAEQFRALLESNFEHIRRSVTDNFISEEAQHELRAKVTANVEFDIVGEVSRVTVKLAWSARYTDEMEVEVDPNQTKLPLEGGAE